MKKTISYISMVLVLMFTVFADSSWAIKPIQIWMGGDYLTMDTYPVIKDNRTLVPVRFVAEELGFDVGWKESERQVTISKKDRDKMISLKIGDKNLVSTEDGKKVMDVAPEIIRNRTMVPVRFVAEEFGVKVDWDKENRVVILGEGYDRDKVAKLPFDEPVDFAFSSGVGAWGTKMTLYPDGTFTGYHSDMNRGETGRDYPNGSQFICHFYGKFTNIKPTVANTYTLELENLKLEEKEGDSWVKDGIRYIVSFPYGLEESKFFEFYTPEKDRFLLSQDFLSWSRGIIGENESGYLGSYGICNLDKGYGFFSFEE